MACEDWKIKVNELRIQLEELKKDIVTLQKNVNIAESLLDSVKCKEDLRKVISFDFEKGLKHIELF